jgi:indole-3-glycerol phosphate synthase
MSSILDAILQSTRKRVHAAKRKTDLGELAARAFSVRSRSTEHVLRSAITNDAINIIAEFKRASPSKGLINDVADPAETAALYQSRGACAISVLTEPDYFRGSLEDLQAVRNAVSIPVLRKDFVVDEFQIYESAVAGADAILLIVAALSIGELKRFQAIARELGIDALVEVHNVEEMKIAGDLGASLIGVNNRDLRTFNVSLDVSRDLSRFAPDGAALVSESGLSDHEEIKELRRLGYSAFLIGETLMRGKTSLLGDEVRS